MFFFQQQINLRQLAIGLFTLGIGTLVYLVDRPPQHTYFISSFLPGCSLYQVLPNLFGVFGTILPDFAHVFAFIMITGGLLACGRTGCLGISLLWFATDALFEIGQHYSAAAAAMVPSWFQEVPGLQHTGRFFLTGTFDWMDLAAILAGAVSAYLALRLTMQPRPIRSSAGNFSIPKRHLGPESK